MNQAPTRKPYNKFGIDKSIHNNKVGLMNQAPTRKPYKKKALQEKQIKEEFLL